MTRWTCSRVGLALFACSLLFSLPLPASAETALPQPALSPSTSAPADAERAQVQLRRIDRQLERWAEQLATPGSERPGVEAIDGAIDRLRRLAADGESKAEILWRRAEALRAAIVARRDLSRHALEPAAAPRTLPAPSRESGDCSTATEIGLGAWIVDRGATAGDGLWLSFTAPAAGPWVVHTVGSRADTRLETWSDCRADAASASDDDGVGLRSRLVFEAEAGQTVHLRLASSADDRVVVTVAEVARGLMSGRVTESASGDPMVSARVEIHSQSDSGSIYYTTSTYTDSDGFWSVSGLDDGIFYALVDLSYGSEFFDQIYDGVDCYPSSYSCSFDDATPIDLAGQITNIDFAVHRGAVITGRVREAGSGEALEGVYVAAQSTLGSTLTSGTTDAAGRFRLAGLQSGDVKVTATSSRHLDERWPDTPCEGIACPITDGTAISVVIDSEVPDIDFELDRLASIEGRVTLQANGEPIRYIEAYVFDAAGILYGSARTDSDGRYVVAGLPAGSFYLKVTDYGYIPRFWPDVECPPGACGAVAGDPIDLAEGESRSGIDLEISAYASLSGEVVDEASGDGVTSGRVSLYNAAGSYVDNDYIYSGDFSIDRLPPGVHFAVYTSYEFEDRLYDDLPCDGCDPTTGTAIPLAPDDVITGIDFAVERLGSLAGTVTWEATGDPASGIGVELYRADGSSIGYSATTAPDGTYRFNTVEPGEYRVRTSSQAAMDELWDDLPCEGVCDVTAGTPVDVVLGAEVVGIDFALTKAAAIHGEVVSATTLERITGGRVRLYASSGEWVRTDYSYGGSFAFVGLDPGTYYLLAEGFDDHFDRVSGGAGSCDYYESTCDPTAGTGWVAAVGTDVDVEIALELGGIVEGSVEDADGQPVTDGSVRLYDSSGALVGQRYLYAGPFRFSGLETDDYTMLFTSHEHLDEWWQDIAVVDSCPNAPCDPSVGTAIGVVAGTTTGDIDFVVDTLGTLSGRVVDAETGEAATGGYVEAYDAGGTRVDTASIGSQGTFAMGAIEVGSFHLVVRNLSYHLDTVYDGERCDPDCDPATGMAVAVGLDEAVSVEIPVLAGPGLEGRVVDAATGWPLAGIGLDLWNEFGDRIDTTATDALGRFRVPIGSSGHYYLSTDTGSDHADMVWPNVDCPDGPAFAGLCDPLAGDPLILGEYDELMVLKIHLEGPSPPGVVFVGDFESGGLGSWVVP